MTITIDEVLRSIEANISSYQEEFNKTPKDASVLRNFLQGHMIALHKLKADIVLKRDSNEPVNIIESFEGEK